MSKKYCVVGGGIAGLLSAIQLAKAGQKVYLVDKEKDMGGLLRSQMINGISFDYGTHIIAKSHIPEIDELMFDMIQEPEWESLHHLKNGNYFKKLNSTSPFVDTHCLEKNDYDKAIDELKNLKANDGSKIFENLEEQLLFTFGKVLTEKIYQPICQKFFNKPLNELAVNSYLLLGPGRLLAFTADETRELKKEKHLDNALAFHSFLEGIKTHSNFYPSEVGIGLWVNKLLEKIKNCDVTVLNGVQLTNLNLKDKKIASFTINGNQTIECDEVIWTIASPPVFALTGLKTPPPLPGFKFEKVNTSIHHFKSLSKPLTDLHYITCFDPDVLSFRITLYDNLQPNVSEKNNYYRTTVEVLSHGTTDLQTIERKVMNELVTMKIFSRLEDLEVLHSEVMPAGFPLPTKVLKQQEQLQLSCLQEQIENLHFVGRGQGNAFFMNAVLIDTFQKIDGLLKCQ